MLNIKKNKDLQKFNFYNLKVKVKYFFEIKNKDDIVKIFQWIGDNKIKNFFILGEGSNIIFKKDYYDGIILKISNNFLKEIKNGDSFAAAQKKSKKSKIFEVGAGKNLDKFLYYCQRKNIFYPQNLSSIPGSVGAGVLGNVGAFGSEIKKFIFGVWVFDIAKKEFIFLKNKECIFSYRNSIFKLDKKKFIIYSAIFDFSKSFQKEMENFYKKDEYFSLKHFSKKHKIKNLKEENLRKEIKGIRKKIYPNIKKYPNIGSTFKNTEITKTQLKNILKKYPNIPNWKLDSGKIKIPTAYIFDKILNLNGKIFGNIKVDEKRPLFFKNTGKATGKEFFNLCQKIKKMTEKKIGIRIEEEVFFVR